MPCRPATSRSRATATASPASSSSSRSPSAERRALGCTTMASTYRIPGLVLTEHEFEVPLDHATPGGDAITVFAREVADPDGLDRPFLVFFQGGPGAEASRPTRHPSGPGWLDRALSEFRVLMGR